MATTAIGGTRSNTVKFTPYLGQPESSIELGLKNATKDSGGEFSVTDATPWNVSEGGTSVTVRGSPPPTPESTKSKKSSKKGTKYDRDTPKWVGKSANKKATKHGTNKQGSVLDWVDEDEEEYDEILPLHEPDHDDLLRMNEYLPNQLEQIHWDILVSGVSLCLLTNTWVMDAGGLLM